MYLHFDRIHLQEFVINISCLVCQFRIYGLGYLQLYELVWTQLSIRILLHQKNHQKKKIKSNIINVGAVIPATRHQWVWEEEHLELVHLFSAGQQVLNKIFSLRHSKLNHLTEASVSVTVSVIEKKIHLLLNLFSNKFGNWNFSACVTYIFSTSTIRIKMNINKFYQENLVWF